MTLQKRNRFIWVSFSFVLWLAFVYWFYLLGIEIDTAELLDPTNDFDPFNGMGTLLATGVLLFIGTPILLTLWWKLSKNFPQKLLFFKFIRPHKIGFFFLLVCFFELLNFVALFLIAQELSFHPNGINLAALFLFAFWFLHCDLFRFILSQPPASL